MLFVNDSQGTQPDAVIAALRSFEPPIVLICGGRSKNVPIDALAREVAQRAAAVIVIGETADEFAAAFSAAGAQHIERARDLEEAVRPGDATARALGGGTVLLSPAATSFDMFVDYAARGTAFKEIVRKIAAEHARGGHALSATTKRASVRARLEQLRRTPRTPAAAPVIRGPQRERHEPDWVLLLASWRWRRSAS